MIGPMCYEAGVSVYDITTDGITDPLLRTAVYWWDPVAKSYVPRTELQAGRAYWLASTAACTLFPETP